MEPPAKNRHPGLDKGQATLCPGPRSRPRQRKNGRSHAQPDEYRDGPHQPAAATLGADEPPDDAVVALAADRPNEQREPQQERQQLQDIDFGEQAAFGVLPGKRNKSWNKIERQRPEDD